jgi:hypothetical protein
MRFFGLLLALKTPQRPQLIAYNWMGAWGALLDPADVQRGGSDVHLIPSQVHQLGNAHAVSIGHEDHRGVPMAVAVALGGFHEPLDFGFGQIFAAPKVAVAASSRGNCPFLVVGVTSCTANTMKL